MKISVIITTFNLELYIEECIQSVLNQSHQASEIIIADDCSTDNTIAIAKTIHKDIIIVKQQENSGALRNTLAGLNKSTCEIVAFLDGDDTWPTDKLERVYNEFVSDSSIYLVTHNHRRVDSKGKSLGITDETHTNLSKLRKLKSERERQTFLRDSALNRRGLWFGSAYSLRRQVLPLTFFNNLIDKFPDARFAYLDLVLAPFVVQLNSNGKISYLDDLVFSYRIHPANSAASNTLQKQLLAIKRGRCTTLTTRFVLTEINTSQDVLKSYDNILLEFDYLESLYTNNKIQSLALFFRLISYFKIRRTLFKEIARVALVSLFGSRFFFALK